MAANMLSSGPVSGWGRIDVERLGGLPGYGMPGSRIRSRGHILAENLSDTDQDRLRELFQHPAETPKWMHDEFRYHLTRRSDCGPQTVVVAESVVSQMIRDCVRDEMVS